MAEKKGKDPHADHRARMYQRIQENGLESLHPHEVLEVLLYISIPRKNTNLLGHELIEHFGGFCQVLEASEEELRQVPGIGPTSARWLHMHLELFRYYQIRKRNPRKALDRYEDMVEYLEPLFYGQQQEILYLIAMDDNRIPLRDITVARGIPNKVSFDVSTLARAVVTTNCTCALLAHNHLSDPAVPSAQDVETTHRINELLRTLSITLVDHVILSPNDNCSMLHTRRI